MGISSIIPLSVCLLASTASVNATPLLQNRGTIPHDKVVSFGQLIPSGTVGDLYKAYQPFLKVVNGCVPFPAVDASGNTSGGLEPTGDSKGACSSSSGQIYVRSAVSGTKVAIMYSWYFPKDSPSTGLGHRHDWEGVIVWLNSIGTPAAANIAAVCPSAHGGWKCSKDFSLKGTGPLIKYESTYPLDHECGLTKTVGGQQPLVAWDSLPAAAKSALQNTDFGKANVPFKDPNFANNLQAATY